MCFLSLSLSRSLTLCHISEQTAGKEGSESRLLENQEPSGGGKRRRRLARRRKEQESY